MYEKELKISQQAARQAGQFLKKEFFNWRKSDNVKYKLHHEQVTWCDSQSEKIIFKLIKKHFPNYTILSEESGRKDKPSDYTWIIDPLDGTTNFTIHHAMFTVSIALLYKNKIVMGVIYDPLLDEMYCATKGQGAFKNNKRLQVSKAKTLKNSIFTYCHGSGKNNTKKAHKLYEKLQMDYYHCYHFACTSLELAMVASGRIAAHMVSGAKIWDIAAAIILLQEAGAKVTDWKNKTWSTKSTSLLAANKTIHGLCLKELKKIKVV